MMSSCPLFPLNTGQYLGMKKPMPEYHTTISSFDERVSLLKDL